MKHSIHSIWRIFAVGGLGVAILGGGAIAASADRLDDLRNAVKHDIDVISQDQRRIDDMQRKLDLQRQNRDRDLARKTRADISRARLDLRRDQAKLRTDQRELDRYDGHRRHSRP